MKKLAVFFLFSLLLLNSCKTDDPLSPENDAPLKPFNPSPINNSVSVPINSSISWKCSDPNGDSLFYNIYFGTDSIPPLLRRGYTDTTYSAFYLTAGTKYYWKIIVSDSYGAMDSSDLWSFTTAEENHVPNAPSNPTPTDYATAISRTTSLSWNCTDPDGDEMSYDIYFGTTSNPSLMKSGLNSTTVTLDTLGYNMKYYWKVIAKDSKGGTTTSPVWNFTTAEYSEMVGTWISEGANVAYGLRMAPIKVKKIVTTLNANKTYTTVITDSSNVTTTLTGTFAFTPSSYVDTLSNSFTKGAKLNTVMVNQSTPVMIIQTGIAAISGANMAYEVVQTTPTINGVSAATVQGGFGSTTISGVKYAIFIQKFVKQ